IVTLRSDCTATRSPPPIAFRLITTSGETMRSLIRPSRSLPPPAIDACRPLARASFSSVTACCTSRGLAFVKTFKANPYSLIPNPYSLRPTPYNLLPRQRQILEPPARRVEDGVGDRGDRRNDRRLAERLRAERTVGVLGLHEDDVNLR